MSSLAVALHLFPLHMQDLAVISSEKTALTVVTFPMLVTYSVVLTHLTALLMESTRYVCTCTYEPSGVCIVCTVCTCSNQILSHPTVSLYSICFY